MEEFICVYAELEKLIKGRSLNYPAGWIYLKDLEDLIKTAKENYHKTGNWRYIV